MSTPQHTHPLFAPSLTIFQGPLSTTSSLSSCSQSKRQQCSHPKRPIQMLAKFQNKQESQSSEQPNDDSSLDKILPPPILPTLSTLTNRTSKDESSASLSAYDDGSKTEDSILPLPSMGQEKVTQMGPGLSKQQENAVVQFLKEVVEEFRSIEWTPFGRVVRLTFLVLIIIIVATAALYVVDGFLSRLAKSFFEDKIF